MSILKVDKLCKSYPAFKLSDVSFELGEGKITGFIGRNGAGKTTTLKALLDYLHPDSGTIEFFGKPFADNEFEIKKRIGFVSGGIDYYSRKKLKTITSVTRGFYDNWDEPSYEYYTKMFGLDENKTPAQLSAGMKVKYSLALALSHNAQLLILDEPTSGLDPVSRDDLLDVFMTLSDKGKTIFFSTHITSDLDKCADNIIYIKNGVIIARSELSGFVDSYGILSFPDDNIAPEVKSKLIGLKRAKAGFTALIRASDAAKLGLAASAADLEEIMIHFEKEDA